MKGALDVLTTAPEFDLVVVGGRLVGAVLSRSRGQADHRQRRRAEADRGVSGAGGARRAGAARRRRRAEFPHAGGLRRRGRRRVAAPRAAADRSRGPASRPAPARMLDELEAYALLDRLGVPHAPSIALDASITQAPALPFPYPVAVKALSAKIAHKSDVGGVVLNVRDDDALLAAIGKIRQATKVDRVLVQPMMSGLGEVLIGYRVDADVGPLVMLAAGGILAEIHRDRSLRLAPVDLAEAQAMIGEVAALKALAGYRGKPRGRSRRAGAGAGGAVAACGLRRPRRRRGRGQSADRPAEGRRRRRRRCAGEAGIAISSCPACAGHPRLAHTKDVDGRASPAMTSEGTHDRTHSRPGERRRQSGAARALSQHHVPAGGRRPGLSRQDHRRPHRLDHARARS